MFRKSDKPEIGVSVVVGMIAGYQRLGNLFPTHPGEGGCRFYPSCSEYTRLAVLKYGVRRGIAMGVKRIMRCNPWTPKGQVEFP